MTIETTVSKTIQSGNGSNKDFDFAFEIPDEDSLSLTKRGSDGTETAITTNFTVTGIGDEAGGTVNYPTSGSALASNEKIIIKRVVALKQLENLRNQGDYSLEDIEDAFDRAVMLCQQLQEQIDRSLKLPLTSSSTYVAVDDFVANKLLYVSSDGTKVKMSDADFGPIQTYLTALAAIAADISAVAAIDTEVTTVAGIDAEVVIVAGIAANVTTVAAIAANVTTVAAIDTEVAAVAALATEIIAVYVNLSDIQNAASFNFPTLGGSDVGKFLKVNAGYNGYDLVASANLTALGDLAGAANKIAYFTGAGTMALRDISYSLDPIAIANNSGTPNTIVDFSSGVMTFSDKSGQVAAAAISKILQSSGSWTAGTGQNGLLSGVRANNSTYHWFALFNPTTLAVDFGAILGVAATTPDPTSVLPSGYTKYQYIASCLTDGSGNIRAGSYHFNNDGSYTFEYKSMVQDRTASNAPTTPTLLTMSVPLGLKVQVETISFFIFSPAAYALIIDPAKNTTASSTNYSIAGSDNNGSSQNSSCGITSTDTSSRVSIMATLANSFQILTKGFKYNVKG